MEPGCSRDFLLILLDTYLYFLLLKHTLMTWLPESFWSLYGVLGVFKVKFEFRDAQGKAKSMFNLQALSFCYPNSLVQFTLIRKELSTYGIWRSMTVVVSRFFFGVPAMFRKHPCTQWQMQWHIFSTGQQTHCQSFVTGVCIKPY